MSSIIGRAAIYALAVQGVVAWPRNDSPLDARAVGASSGTDALPNLPSYTPGDEGRLSCPGDAKKPFTDSTGNQYTVSCYTDYNNHDQRTIYAVSLEACGLECSKQEGCRTVVWRPGTGNGPCYLKSETGYSSSNLDLMALVRNITVSSSAVVTTITTSIPPLVELVMVPAGTDAPTTRVDYPATVTFHFGPSGISSQRLEVVMDTSIATPTSNANSKSSTSPSIVGVEPPSVGATSKSPYLPCGVFNHKGNTFYLRTHVTFGKTEFDNLYVQNVAYGIPPRLPSLVTDRKTAAQVYFDYTTTSVAIFHGNCTFSGLKMDPDHNMDSWSPVLVGDEVGSSKMTIAKGELWWDNDRFGSWLACKNVNTGAYELLWWDTITDRGVDREHCGKVQLLTENL